MKQHFFYKLIAIILLSLTHSTWADSHIEAFIAAQYLSLNNTQNRGSDTKDKHTSLGAGIGIYRTSTNSTSYGFVVEISQPITRDDLPGSGQIIGVRPINYLKKYSTHWSQEFYGGFAQYEWIKSAGGYYLGSNIRYRLSSAPLALAFELKYYQDLNYDDSEFDDLIAQGFNSGITLIYNF